jgi:hypothetical protein
MTSGGRVSVVGWATPDPFCLQWCEVTVDELTAGVAIALGGASLDACRAAYCNGGCGPGPGPPALTVACLIRTVHSALDGCNTAPCEVDADCDDADACSSDHCRSGVCTNDCACL